uniref:cytochrome b-245 light chain-like n=1 Tax=Myxine glutinosa TaxID=7769 RepID=UPI003590243A
MRSTREWAIWANEQALASAVIFILGGVVAIAGQFHRWTLAVYAILSGVLVLLLEYPRTHHPHGVNTERRGQHHLAMILGALGPITSNYYIRAILLILVAVPGGFLLSTILGAICFAIAGVVYLMAAVNGERWKPCSHATCPKLNPNLQGPSSSSTSAEPRAIPSITGTCISQSATVMSFLSKQSGITPVQNGSSIPS